jgi:hypothetical protein
LPIGIPNTDINDPTNRYLAPYKAFHDQPFKGTVTAPGFPGFDPVDPTVLLRLAASGLNRAQEMAAATAMTSLLSTGAAIASAGTDGPARRVALAVLNSVGIQFAIEPWFKALTTNIPNFDKAVVAHRAEVVKRPAGP